MKAITIIILIFLLSFPLVFAHTDSSTANDSDRGTMVSSMMEHMGFTQGQAEGMYDYMLNVRDRNMAGFGSGMMGSYGMMAGWSFIWWFLVIGLLALIYLAVIKLIKDIWYSKKR